MQALVVEQVCMLGQAYKLELVLELGLVYKLVLVLELLYMTELEKVKVLICMLGLVCMLELVYMLGQHEVCIQGIGQFQNKQHLRRNHCNGQRCRLRFGHGHQGDGRRKIQQRFRWHLGFRSWRSQRQSNRPLHHIHKQKVGVGAFREPFRMELACMELELEHGMVLVVVGQLGQQQRRQRK